MKTKLTFWRTFHGEAKGVKVSGDEHMPPTPSNWIQFLWYVFFVWNKAMVFEISTVPESGYRIGFRNANGQVRAMAFRHIREKRFAVRLGGEACSFFAFGPSGEEIPIEVIAGPVDQNDPYFDDVPLY